MTDIAYELAPSSPSYLPSFPPHRSLVQPGVPVFANNDRYMDLYARSEL